MADRAFSPCYRMLFSFWLWSRGLGRAAIALMMFFHSLALLVLTSSRSERLPCDRLVCSMQSGWEWLKVYKYWDLKVLLSQAAKAYEQLSSIPGRLHVWLTGSVVKMCTDTGYWITAYWFSTVSRNELWSVSFCFPFFMESEKCLRKNWTSYILGKYLFYHTRELLYSRALCKKTISESVLGKLTQFWSISVLKLFFFLQIFRPCLVSTTPTDVQTLFSLHRVVLLPFTVCFGWIARLKGQGTSRGVVLLWWSNAGLVLRKVRVLLAREPGGALKSCTHTHTCLFALCLVRWGREFGVGAVCRVSDLNRRLNGVVFFILLINAVLLERD